MSLRYSFIGLLKRCLFFSIFIVQVSLAQGTGTIRGIVYDATTKDVLPGANVIVDGTSIGAASDLDGKFVLRGVPSGNQIIVASYIGYVADSLELNVSANRSIELNFNLVLTTVEGGEVIVTAQAQGQLEAINQQLASDKIANIVSEARIQELPDFNAAQTISRLPGVSTTQSSGEENKVVIRGLSPKYNAIEIEGIRLSATGSSSVGLSSNTDIADISGRLNNDRSVDLTSISPYMIRTIAVYKSLTPDMNANSIGGTVNMELREAPSGLHWDLKYNQGYTAKSKTYGNYRGVASVSNRFFDDNLGVYLLLNAESYDRNSDNLDAGYGIKAGAGIAVDPATGFRPAEVNTVTLNRHLETRQRYGGNLILDYNIPNGSFKFINLVTRINSDYTDHRQIINYDQGRINWRVQVADNFIDQQMHSLKLDYDLGFLIADLSASYTSSGNRQEDSPVIDFFQTDALQAGVPRDNKPPEQLTYLLPTVTFADSNVVLGSANLFSNDYKEEKFTYKADFELPFTFGTDLTGFFKVGGQLYNQTNNTDQETPYVGFGGGSDITNAIKDQMEANFGIRRNGQGYFNGSWFLNSDNDLFNSFLDDSYGSVYYASNADMLTNIINYIKSRPELNASLRPGDPGNLGGWYDGPYQQLVNDYKYKEDYYSTYAMARFNFLDFMVIGGVRYEKVETEYFAYNAKDARNARQQVMYDTTAFEENEFLLPMAQMKYSPFDWLDIRYAYTQTLARPDYHLLSPKFTVVDLSRQVFAGNPQLEPAKAINHDINLTVHNNEIGLFSIGGFYKTIENFVFNASYQLDAAQNAGVDNISRYIIVRNEVKVVEPAGTNYTVFRPLNNTNDAIVKGIEVDFQHNFWYLPQPFNNIVFGVNYARIYSETIYPWYDVRSVAQPRPLPPLAQLIDSSTTSRLLDQPNHVLNSYIGYDYEGFSSRLSFLFQDNTSTSAPGRDSELDSYSKEYFRIDFSARQKLPWFNSELFLDVQNMNNANTKSIQRSFEGFRNIQNYGLVVNLGIRVRY
ncbi:MAG: hypothetical protein A2057_12070 [Ignavibacteria bacterium GWA2_35_9]|nr:MAG: hypothetical protein A2057_12070 [Ignavibacteria bacterium GWA2_35_9]OGU48599.1 MAG: hypothetical protein A2080_12935 [Ignavibacteria bacterium GWC2_36_12]